MGEIVQFDYLEVGLLMSILCGSCETCSSELLFPRLRVELPAGSDPWMWRFVLLSNDS